MMKKSSSGWQFLGTQNFLPPNTTRQFGIDFFSSTLSKPCPKKSINALKIQLVSTCLTMFFLIVFLPFIVCAEEGGERDPFMPLVTKDGEFIGRLPLGREEKIDWGDLLLEGIISDSRQGSMAIINGIIVREKEEIGKGIRVERIEDNRVELKKGENSYFLELYKEE